MGKAMATQTLVLPEHIYTGWVDSSDGHEHLIKIIFLVIPQGTSLKKNKKKNYYRETGISVETARLKTNTIIFFS